MPRLTSLACALLLVGSLAIAPRFAHAQLAEGFDNIGTLGASGWVLKNNSNPVGSTGWFQGEPAAFSAQSGPADSYIAANFNNSASDGTISNWLITPVLTLSNGGMFSFFTRTVDEVAFPDRLELRLSTAGTSSDVGTTETSEGNFTKLLLSVNPDLKIDGYPSAWTEYSVTLSGLQAPTDGRFAFRYFVSDLSRNADYIGIDNVSYTARAVPEPASAVLLGLGFAGLALRRRRSA